MALADGDLLVRGRARIWRADLQGPEAAILAFGDEMEDTKWRSISDALSATLDSLRDVVIPVCQVQQIRVSDLCLLFRHS